VAERSLPWFIVHPGETDLLFTGSAIFLVVIVMAVGSLYLRLHHLPEHMSQGTRQYQFVAVLSLLAMFTHVNAFWVAALLIALVPIPDFWTPLSSMAGSLARIATGRNRSAAEGARSEPVSASNAIGTPAAKSPKLRFDEADGTEPPELTGQKHTSA